MAEGPRLWARREAAGMVVPRQGFPTQPTVVETGQRSSTWLIGVISSTGVSVFGTACPVVYQGNCKFVTCRCGSEALSIALAHLGNSL